MFSELCFAKSLFTKEKSHFGAVGAEKLVVVVFFNEKIIILVPEAPENFGPQKYLVTENI